MLNNNTAPRRFFYVPVNFEPLELLPPAQHHLADSLAYILSLINQRLVFERLDPEQPVPLMSKLLERVLGSRHYAAILRLAEQLQIIEREHSYEVGKRSKGCRLTDKYRHQPHKRYHITDTNLLSRLEHLKDDMHAGAILPVHKHLTRFLEQVDFDCPNLSLLGQYDSQALAIQDGNWWVNACDSFGWRFHSNLTNLKRELRPYLRYQGESLCNIDIANSQPLFLAALLLNYYGNDNNTCLTSAYDTPSAQLDMIDKLYTIFSVNKEQQQEKKPEEGTSKPLCSPVLPLDLKHYITLCQSGTVYEYIAKIANTTRDESKTRFFQVLFASNQQEKHMPLGNKLEEHFPSLIAAIRTLKKKDPKHAARLLQRTEASFIMNRVVRRLMTDHPDTFIATIHDSLLTTPASTALVATIARQEFAELGIAATLRVEQYHQDEQQLAA